VLLLGLLVLPLLVKMQSGLLLLLLLLQRLL
jgi:hypothetical protein